MILTPNLVVSSLSSKTKVEVIHELSSLFFNAGRLSNLEVFIDNVLQREEEFSTGFGNGIAIPHGKSHVVLKPSLAVAKLKLGIDWQAIDEKPVHLIFLLAVPEEASGNTHLKIMAKLAESLMDEDRVNELESIEKNDDLFRYVNKLLGGQFK